MEACGEASSTIDSSNFEFSTNDIDIPIAIRKSVRACTKHHDSLSASYRTFLLSLSSISISQGWQEAINDPKWKKAMINEMKALIKNETREHVDLLLGKKPVIFKLMFIIKHKVDGSIDRFKTRLVAKGFTQAYGMDDQETFTLVAKMNLIRIFLSCTTNFGWDL